MYCGECAVTIIDCAAYFYIMDLKRGTNARKITEIFT